MRTEIERLRADGIDATTQIEVEIIFVDPDCDPTDGEPDPREETYTRDQIRSRRPRVVRAKVENIKRLGKAALEAGRLAYPEETKHLRPRTRAECADGPRPCPFVSCKHHLYLDVSPGTGSIKINFPDIGPEDLAESCALDVADREGQTLEEVGAIANLTRERIRQVETKALQKVHDAKSNLTDWRHEYGRKTIHLRVITAEDIEGQDEHEFDTTDRVDIGALRCLVALSHTRQGSA